MFPKRRCDEDNMALGVLKSPFRARNVYNEKLVGGFENFAFGTGKRLPLAFCV